MDMLDAVAAIKLLVLGITVEALVNLFFKAAPLQGFRFWLVKSTPWLYSKWQDTHLFDCKYCVSVWVGLVVAICWLYLWNEIVQLFIAALVIGRLSNFIHILYSYVSDKQMDLRVTRNRILESNHGSNSSK